MSKLVIKNGESLEIPREEDYEEAAFNGVWHPTCPFCGSATPVEPDTDEICCLYCGRKFKLYSIRS